MNNDATADIPKELHEYIANVKSGSITNGMEELPYVDGDGKAFLQVVMHSPSVDIIRISTDVHMTGVGAEYAWINDKYVCCAVTQQSLRCIDGRFFDVLHLHLADHEHKVIYFDISSFFTQ